jgi:hypothetical protein
MTVETGILDSSLSLEARVLNLIKVLSVNKDEKLISDMEEFLRQRRITAYEAKMKPMTDEEYLNRVGRGVEDMRNGRVTSDEDYLKEIAEEENK